MVYIAVLIMGFILGLLGGGGSILTVPILVYLVGMSAVHATSYSLLIVGLTSFVASIKYFKEDILDLRLALLFAIPSMFGVWIARQWIVPLLDDMTVMIVFSVLMIVISGAMIMSKSTPQSIKPTQSSSRMGLIGIEGLGVGLLTGIVGAGGGFMIVPALVFLAQIPIKQAIATSLFIITLKSFVGVGSDLILGFQFDMGFLIPLLSFTFLGSFIGAHFNKNAPTTFLRQGFGVFVMVMGLFILFKTLYS